MSDDLTPDEPQSTPEAGEDAREPIEPTQGASLPTGPFVLDLGPKNIEMEMRNKVGAALRQPMLADDLEYILAPVIMPNQQNQPMPAFALTLAIKSPILGEYIQATAILPSPWATADDVAIITKQLSEALLQGRSAQVNMLAQEQSAKGAVEGLINPNGQGPGH